MVSFMALPDVIRYVRLFDKLEHMKLLPGFGPSGELPYQLALDSIWGRLSLEERGAIEDVMLLVPRKKDGT